MADRQRYIDDAGISLAMYCDENRLTLAQGIKLAQEVSDWVQVAAEERANYLPAEMLDTDERDGS